MTFEKILENVRAKAAKADVSDVDFLAVQINVLGEGAGVFYIEAKDGKVSVEPYEYNDRNCAITITADDLVKMMDGKFDPVAAFTQGRIQVTGDLGKALQFSDFIKSNT